MNANKLPLLIQSLQNPVLFDHQIKYFKMIETHISWVLLTGDYAYKIKKPLDLGFLDFSSLEKRRHFCHEETRLNTRLAPDIYLGVVAIYGTPAQPNLTGADDVIEYAVKMQQFEENNTFDQLLTRNQLTSAHIKQTAKTIAAFHNKIQLAEVNSEYGSINTVLAPVIENFKQIQQLKSLDKPAYIEEIKSWSNQQHKVLQTLIPQRKQAGFIRECHGDLHLGNIALINDKAVPFDGLEFNPSLYWIDVISEIAFLVMDLQSKQRDDLAFQFLNEYLQHTGDYHGLGLLRFYLVYRAMVRAKVYAIQASQNTSTQAKALSCYQSYLQLARQYTNRPKPKMLIMHGVSASGKSWLSEQIISRHQAIRIRSDIERKRLAQLNKQLNGLYSQDLTEKTYQQLLKLAIDIVTAGYSVIVDATFLLQRHRKLFSQQAAQLGIEFLIIHTFSDKQTLKQRITQRAKQTDNVSDADSSVMENQLNTIEPLSNDEISSNIRVDTRQNEQLDKLWGLLERS